MNKLLGMVESFQVKDLVDSVIDGVRVHGYRNPDDPGLWIRDHSDLLRVARFFGPDVKSTMEFFARPQLPCGATLDFVSPADGGRTGTASC